MGIGAIEALKAAGIKPGDLVIVSVDGTRGGFQAMVDGWFQADVECNPLLGPQVYEMALALMNGKRSKGKFSPTKQFTIRTMLQNYCHLASTKLSSKMKIFPESI
jgi:ABC-type sugar transport system substrate-binding protein